MTTIKVPPVEVMPIEPLLEWQQINAEDVLGVQLVIGAVDTGKSTLARYLYRRYSQSGQPIAFIDGDPGQSCLGPPTTETLVIGRLGDPALPAHGSVWRRFVGSTSPTGHLLQTVVGAKRLCEQARQEGARVIIYDTSGLVDQSQGGLALKAAKVDLLQPQRIYAIQREKELEPLLSMIRRGRRCEVVQFAPSPAVVARNMERRQKHREQQYWAYFQGAALQVFKWAHYGIYPAPRFALNRLVALEDGEGFTLALGIVATINREKGEVTLLLPPVDRVRVKMLTLGDVLVDPITFQDKRLE